MNIFFNNNGKVAIMIMALFVSESLSSQSSSGGSINYNEISGQVNTITTAVPFLMISPDSRAGGMGDAGVATSTDVNSIHWNPSKLAFADKKLAVGVSYVPWLRKLVPDINLAYLSGYYATKESGTFGASLRYFSLGDITFTDINGTEIGQFRPNELAVDIAYARKLADRFSMGLAVRYISSNLSGGTYVDGSQTRPGRSVAADLSALYKNDELELGEKDGILSIGVNVSNIGAKMSYSDRNDKANANFIPINLRLGTSLGINIDEYNSVTFVVDVNKLMVPTQPIYEKDSNGNVIPDGDGGYAIALGKDPNRGIAEGMFGSFGDAPGGSKEELKEINYSLGMEYWYNKLFAIRAGYFFEHPTKGNRQYITLGAGVKYNVFGLDFAYLIPTKQQNPLENTLRFSLTFDFDAFKAQNDDEDDSE